MDQPISTVKSYFMPRSIAFCIGLHIASHIALHIALHMALHIASHNGKLDTLQASIGRIDRQKSTFQLAYTSFHLHRKEHN
jgi:hypothetical protein